jgi:hypothetical protein
MGEGACGTEPRLRALFGTSSQISVIGTGFTVLLDMLANATEAPATVRALVVHGSAGVFACAGVVLYRVVNPD